MCVRVTKEENKMGRSHERESKIRKTLKRVRSAGKKAEAKRDAGENEKTNDAKKSIECTKRKEYCRTTRAGLEKDHALLLEE